MKCAYVTLVALVTLCAATVTNGQRTLAKTETLEIIDKLTSQRPTTWLPAGTIEAKHQEFRAARVTDSAQVDAAIQQQVQAYQSSASKILRAEELQKQYLEAIPFNTRYAMANEYNMTSSVTVKYDGDRFYWNISVTSRTDSVQPSADLAGSEMLDRFDATQSRERVFTWDGQQYTIHTVSANHAIADAANRLPRGLNGPLTAGIVPWGQGTLSSGNLSAAKVTATEVLRDGIDQIEMTIEPADGSAMVFVLDPAKDYAVTSCILTSPNDTITSRYYSGYRKVAGSWVPSTILLERHDLFTDRLLASDKWDLTTIDGTVPGSEQFNAAYRANTVIEYHSPASTKASIYYYSNATDTEQLLAERLTYAATEGKNRQNCATAALKHVAARLGKSVADRTLAPIVQPNGQTTMDMLSRTARGLGLYCRAVRTDLATLTDLPNCQAILHIPGKDHFVVLDRVDDRDAWIVDLSSSTFYYRKNKALLPMDWSEGTALLVSKEPIAGPFAEIGHDALAMLSSGAGWSCTRLLQAESQSYCTATEYDCWGAFRWYYKRWGCEYAPIGSCTTQSLARYAKDECVWDAIRGCTSLYDWEFSYMSACQ
jgi:peptidase C39-like protein